MNVFSYIKSRVHILDVVSAYVNLKKAGLYHKGTCPFHSERTASFTVSPHRNIFYCFGCHATGDVIAFIAQAENCSQIEAAQLLADRFGIQLPETLTAQTTSPDTKKRYFDLCAVVAQWCSEQLAKSHKALSYFKARGFTPETLTSFSIGYFPGGAGAFKDLNRYAQQHNFLTADLLEAHIVEQGKQILYSPFEERLMFPIKDHLGRYCGFGGRIFNDGDQRPKYYNSRENDYFNKGSLLFGFDLAKKSMHAQESAFLVEGYTDCMAMVQHGYTNTVATLGTACTSEHLKILARHIHTLYVLYDGDQAGQTAMLRLAELCWEVALELRVITLPQDEDPASFLSKGGSLETARAGALDIFSFTIDRLGSSFAQLPLSEKMRIATRLLGLIKGVRDHLKQNLLLQHASQVLGIPYQSLVEELHTITPTHSSPVASPPQTSLDAISLLEKKLFSVILSDVTLLQQSQAPYLIKHFTKLLRAILEKYAAHCVQQTHHGEQVHEQFVAFFDSLPASDQHVVTQLLFECDEEDPTKAFDILMLQFQKKHWRAIVKDLRLQLQEAENAKNDRKVKELLTTFEQLKKSLYHEQL